MEPLGAGEVLLRLGIAAAVGMAIGLERERREKAAGLRTLALVSTGSAIFVLAAMQLAPAETVRMAAGIATGIGFLGAGAILRDEGQVIGLTTAAAVWISAALGIASAGGAYVLAAIGTALTLFVLTVLPFIDLGPAQMDARTYEVKYKQPAWDEESAARCLVEAGLRPSLSSVAWSDQGVSAVWRVVGRRERHEKAMRSLREDGAVASFVVKG